jgi:hypothetical protein
MGATHKCRATEGSQNNKASIPEVILASGCCALHCKQMGPMSEASLGKDGVTIQIACHMYYPKLQTPPELDSTDLQAIEASH